MDLGQAVETHHVQLILSMMMGNPKLYTLCRNSRKAFDLKLMLGSWCGSRTIPSKLVMFKSCSICSISQHRTFSFSVGLDEERVAYRALGDDSGVGVGFSH